MSRILAISDIHGCGKTFIKLLQQIKFNKTDKLYLLGDLIDRGANTKHLIDHILKLKNEGYLIEKLLGNHEELMMNSEKSDADLDRWIRNGGDKTLESFGVKTYNDLDIQYKLFFKSMQLKVEVDRYIFVHAGINNIQFKDPFLPSVVLWTRNWYEFLDYKWLGDRYIIHGHTPQFEQDIIKQFHEFEKNRILNIDAGCCYTKNQENKPVFSKLCCIDLTNRKLYFEDNCEN
jgi:calcineurin-like phosphoesterase family protein